MNLSRPYRPQHTRRYRFAKAKPRSTRGISKERTFYLPGKKSIRKPERNIAAAGQTTGRRKFIQRVGKHWHSKPAIIYKPDGREICNVAIPEGYAEYHWRVLLMWVRQNGWCCFRDYDFCPGRLHLNEATFEHENKRTKGQQDDRVALFDPEGRFLRHQNGAAHGECNRIAGSRKLPIYYGDRAIIEEREHATD